MSFSSDIKTELSKINNLKNKQEVYAEFLGYLATANISTKGKNIKFSTENEYNINRFAKLLNNLNIIDYKIELTGKTYIITFKYNNAENNKEESTLQSFENKAINSEIVQLNEENVNQILFSDNLKKAYIRGNFLGAGSINNPKNKYHLEIIFNSTENLQITLNLLSEYGGNAKNLEKTIYIKDGEEISNFLALIGANSAVLKFEEIRVIREMKNNVNRLVNCETANLNKTINASVKQLEIIKKLKKAGKFNKLPEELKEIAILREENPEATLDELGKMLTKPIGKSSVNHRFKKLEEYL